MWQTWYTRWKTEDYPRDRTQGSLAYGQDFPLKGKRSMEVQRAEILEALGKEEVVQKVIKIFEYRKVRGRSNGKKKLNRGNKKK